MATRSFSGLAGVIGKELTTQATLTVNSAPSITTNPARQTVSSGQSVTFTAAVTGKPAPSVQWQVSVNNGPFTNVAGANALALTFSADNSQNGNQYRALVTKLMRGDNPRGRHIDRGGSALW